MPARAEDDDVPIDTKILRGIMLEGLGLQTRRRSRHRLSRTLAAGDPAEPHVCRRRKTPTPRSPTIRPGRRSRRQARARKTAAARAQRSVTARRASTHERRPLRPDELTPGAKPATRGAGRSTIGTEPAPTAQRSADAVANSAINGGLFGSMFGKQATERDRQVHRRAAAHLADRAAARLSDAVAGSALWRRQGQVCRRRRSNY